MKDMNTRLQRVGVKFDIDKPSEGSYKKYYDARTGSSRLYYYKAYASLGLEVGDLAVVVTPTHGATVVTVHTIDPPGEFLLHQGYKWIVDKVDMKAHREREQREYEAQVIEQELGKRVEAARRRLEISDLLKDDDEAVALLESLRFLREVK